MQRFGLFLFAVLAALISVSAPSRAAADFSNWAAVVVAGDWHTHDGGPSEAFDNARRDVAAALLHIGFNADSVEQFSVRPYRYSHSRLLHSDAQAIGDTLWDLSQRASGGCLIYVSSHGSPDGIVMGDKLLTPEQVSAMLDNSCGGRPTVAILSACFSGGFVSALSGKDRMVLTAARADRASFGCSSSDKYPYFDACFLQSIAVAHDFPGLADKTRACVAAMEKKTGMTPPSEPQLSIGSDIATQLPKW